MGVKVIGGEKEVLNFVGSLRFHKAGVEVEPKELTSVVVIFKKQCHFNRKNSRFVP